MGKLGHIEHSVEIAGKRLVFETGKLAAQAGGAVVAHLGDTVILTTTTASRDPKEHLGFFPLTVDVEERMYAAGKIPGGFFKREGRPSEDAILTCRLVDRPLRPTFVEGLRNEIQIVNTILQTTQVDPYDVLAINASSVATMLAGVPFHGPVAALRYGMRRDGTWVAFPTFAELDTDIVFDMVVAGRIDERGEVAILMVEGEATEHAWRMVDAGARPPTEEVIGEALEACKPLLRTLCEAQSAFVEKAGARPATDLPLFPDYTPAVYEAVRAAAEADIAAVFRDHQLTKEERNQRINEVRERVTTELVARGVEGVEEQDLVSQIPHALRAVEKAVVRRMIVEDGVRIDGRGPKDLRPIRAEVNLLEWTHGCGWFERGETNVLTVLALGPLRAAQRLDTLAPEEEKRYIHHYNFPPFSTGETGRIGSPRRREIGHGALAERAVLPVVPTEEQWPYTLRLVSEVTSSNGSTSMASVCASTLALMDGGVPIHAPVAGIAMGLVAEAGRYVTLTDIQGTEDFYGDMDFKVAGTDAFVTALQLDTKLTGIPADVLADALLQAREARLEILGVMREAIPEPRPEVKPGAPRVVSFTIPRDKVGEVIGPKGKIIREIVEDTGAEIDVDDDGSVGIVRIYAADSAKAKEAADRINAIANPTLPEVGERFHGSVVKTAEFGAFVSLTPGVDGLLHISRLSERAGRRLSHAEEFVKVGDKLWVEVKEVLDGGRRFKLDLVDVEASESTTGPAAAPTTTAPDAPAASAPAEGRRDSGRDRRRRRSGGGGGARSGGGSPRASGGSRGEAQPEGTPAARERVRSRQRHRE